MHGRPNLDKKQGCKPYFELWSVRKNQIIYTSKSQQK